MTSLVRALVAGLLALGGLAPLAAAASAVDSAPGECPDAQGVTVVVDFTDLGGDVVVRCVPGPLPDGMTGVRALRVAGFSVKGTIPYGDAFVCRIQGRPAADEDLSYDGEDYREDCHGTPPQQAYWAYWYAEDGGSWRYSSQSAAARQVSEGGFEGWAFSLDGTQQPAYTPDRPNPPPPTTEPPPQGGGRDGSNGDGASSGGGRGSGPPAATTPTPRPTPVAPTDDSTAKPSPLPDKDESGRQRERHGGEDAPERRSGGDDEEDQEDQEDQENVTVTGELPAEPRPEPGGVPGATLAGIALLLGLGATAAGVAWRRRGP